MLHHPTTSNNKIYKLSLTSISCCFLACKEALRAFKPWEEAACESTTRVRSFKRGLLSQVDYSGHGEYLQGEHIPKPRLDFLPQFVVGGLVPGQVPVGGHQDHKGWLVRPAMKSSQYCEDDQVWL